MAVDLTCPRCKERLQVPERSLGRLVSCPYCEAEFRAEEAPLDVLPAEPRPREGVATAPRQAGPDDAPRPRRRERPPEPPKRRIPLVVALCVGGGVLLGVLGVGGGGAYWLNSRARIADKEWQTFSPPDSKFAVEMPGTPVLKTDKAGALTVYRYLVEHKRSDSFFGVCWVDLPPAGAPFLHDIARAERDQFVAKVKGTVARDKAKPRDRAPGWEFVVEGPRRKGCVVEHLFEVREGDRRRIYILAAGGSRLTPDRGDAARFFDSFAFTKQAGPDRTAPPSMARELHQLAVLPLAGDGARQVRTFALTPDGKTLVVAGQGLDVWNLAARTRTGMAQTGEAVEAVAVRDGPTLAWSTLTGVHVAALSDTGPARPQTRKGVGPYSRLAFSRDGSQLAVGGPRGEVKVLDAVALHDVHTLGQEGQPVGAVTFSHDGGILYAGWVDGRFVGWDAAKGRQMVSTNAHKGGVQALASAARVGRIASACDDGSVRVWVTPVLGDKATLPLANGPRLTAVALSHDGRLVAAGTAEGMVHVWDVEAKREIAAARKYYRPGKEDTPIARLEFTPDGQTLVGAALGDRAVTLWALAEKPPG